MTKKMKWVAVVMFSAVVLVGLAEVFSTPASAASGCWQVDCNTCCRGKGGVICTQRACV